MKGPKVETVALDPEIENRFTYHAPTSAQVKVYKELREKAKELAYLFKKHVPAPDAEGCIRGIQIALMSANAAIACHVEPTAEES